MTGVGDFLLGFGESAPANGLAESLLASARNLSDAQLIWGGLLGVVGLFLECAAFFAVYRLMVDASPKYAHIYRSGIIGMLWLAPIGCHMNVAIMNIAYKYLLDFDAEIAAKTGRIMVYAFCVPLWVLLILFWVPMLVVQWKAFSKGLTPYPAYAKWFNLILGALPPVIVGAILGLDKAWGAGIAMTLLSCGNAYTFIGLLATLPSQERFTQFENELKRPLD